MATVIPIVEPFLGGPQRQLFPGDTIGGGNDGAGEELQFLASENSDLGDCRFLSPIVIDDVIAGNPFPIRWGPAFTQAVLYVGGLAQANPNVQIDTATFIPALLSDTSRLRQNVAPGFSAHTLFNSLPIIENLGNVNLFSSLVLNVGVVHARTTAGTSTCVNTTGVSFSPQTRAEVAGAVMTRTDGAIGLRIGPTFSTVVGSTVNLGTIRGMYCFPPAQALFQPSTGVENLTAYYGVDFTNITTASSGDKVVIRSAMTAAGNRYFLQNNGGAQSDFGGGFILDTGIVQVLSNTLGLSLGNPGGSLQILWDGSQKVQNPIVGDNLLTNFAVGSTVWSSSGATWQALFDCNQFALGQAGTVGNGVGLFVAKTRATAIGGDWADFNNTASGNFTPNAALGSVIAWNVNSIAYTGGSGSVVDTITLNVGGMTTSTLHGSDPTALRVTGRSALRGCTRLDPINPASINGNVAAWSGLLTATQSNSMRGWARVVCDATGTLQGIDSTAALDGDKYECTNVGANTLTINDNDGAAAAADQIITTTGAAITIAVDEAFDLIYDGTSARWRVYKKT